LSQLPSLLSFHPKFKLDFVLVAMEAKVLDMRISLLDIGDAFTGEAGGQALLPEEVTAFDFAFGLRGWRVAKADAVEVQSLAQLGQGVWVMGEKQTVKIDMDLQTTTPIGRGCLFIFHSTHPLPALDRPC
jgi:hypothetical protein